MLLNVLCCACCVNTTDSIEEFEAKVKAALSSIKYKWLIVCVANYHSQSKAVKYILDNFTTIDILSDDIDFYFPGYSSASKMPIIPNREVKEKEVLNQAIMKLHDISKDKDLSIEKILEIEERLRSLKNVTDTDIENYHGDSRLTEIHNKRLGNINFSEEAFATFVADFMNKTRGLYKYLGGCDLVMVPYFNNELQYSDCSVFHLENIVNKETKLSLDEFLLRVLDTLCSHEAKLNVPFFGYDEPFKSSICKFSGCINEVKELLSLTDNIPDDVKDILAQADALLLRCNQTFERTFRKQKLISQAESILELIRTNRDLIVNKVVVRSLLWKLYEEAIKEIESISEQKMIEKIISDIERHVNWKLSDTFYFISYSTKDKVKAELIRKLLQENGAHVWIAPDGIPQGRDYSMIIPTTLRFTKNFVLILTDNSAKSKWVSREIDEAINNSATNLKIVLADGFQLEQLKNYPDIGFYLNKVQISSRYEDLIQNSDVFKQFME